MDDILMNDYAAPSVTEYGDVDDLTRGNWHGDEWDGTIYVEISFHPIDVDVTPGMDGS